MSHKEWDKIRELSSGLEMFWTGMVDNQICTKNTVSCVHTRICLDTTDNTLDVKGKWELEANTIIADDEWEKSWVIGHKCLSIPNWKEFSWKLRINILKLLQRYQAVTEILAPSARRDVDFFHIFRGCPKLQSFWEKVKREKGKILHLDRSLEPPRIILGNMPLDGLPKNKGCLLKRSFS